MKTIKRIISLLIGIPAFIIFAGEISLEYTWLQVISAFVLVGLFLWNYEGGKPWREV